MARRAKRMRRAYLKRWTGKPLNTGPQKEGMAALYQGARTTAGRSDQTQHKPAEHNPMLKPQTPTQGVEMLVERFKRVKPVLVIETNRAGTQRKEIIDPAPPIVRVILQRMWQSNFRQGFETFHFISLLNLTNLKLRLYFAGDTFVFVRENKEQVKRSILYNSKEEAMEAYDNNCILWKTPIPK